MTTYKPVLVHHGILGQKWGERRFQYEDGSLTPEGKRRYNKVSNNISESRFTRGKTLSPNNVSESRFTRGKTLSPNSYKPRLVYENKNAIKTGKLSDANLSGGAQAILDKHLEETSKDNNNERLIFGRTNIQASMKKVGSIPISAVHESIFSKWSKKIKSFIRKIFNL